TPRALPGIPGEERAPCEERRHDGDGQEARVGDMPRAPRERAATDQESAEEKTRNVRDEQTGGGSGDQSGGRDRGDGAHSARRARPSPGTQHKGHQGHKGKTHKSFSLVSLVSLVSIRRREFGDSTSR